MAAIEQPARGARGPSVWHMLLAQIGYQLRVLVRSPLGSFATLVVPLMVLLAVNLLYKGTRLESRGGILYTQFFTPAMVAFAVVNACYMAVIPQITLARDEGILKRIRGTPLPPWIYMTARLVSAGLVGLISAVVVVAVGAGVYGFEVVWGSVPAVLVVLAVGMFCFCALALAVTVLVRRADSAIPVAWGTILPLCFISDVFIPIDEAPHWLQRVASFFPLRPFADDLESAFNPVQGGPGLHPAHLELIAAWGVAAAAFALLAFRWEPSSRGPRRGASQRPAVFAVDRVRALLEERGDRSRAGRTEATTASAAREEGPRRLTARPVEASLPARADGVERIEGPAPSEDSSVPPQVSETER